MKRISKDSNAYAVLRNLVSLGGKANRESLLKGIGPRDFYHAMESLRSRFLVEMISEDGLELFKATPAGKGQVAEYEYAPVAEKPLQMVLPRVAKPFTPLRMSCGAVPYRPGSDDHRQIPSLMGSIRNLPSGEVIE